MVAEKVRKNYIVFINWLSLVLFGMLSKIVGSMKSIMKSTRKTNVCLLSVILHTLL